MKTAAATMFALILSQSIPIFSHAQAPSTVSAVAQMSTGVVKKVDAEQGKITISHGPLKNLDMSAMTMLFRVADPKMLTMVKTGDSIEFIAEKVNGAFTITRLKQAGAQAAPAPPSDPASATVPAAATSSPSATTPQSKPASPAMPVSAAHAARHMGKPGDPANPAEVVPAPVYQSAFSDYLAAHEMVDGEPSEKVWRAANDEMARLGGHAGHTRDVSDAADKPMAGATHQQHKDMAKPPAMPAGHEMKNMNKGK